MSSSGICSCLAEWLEKCKVQFSSEKPDVDTLLNDLSVAWCGCATKALKLIKDDGEEGTEEEEEVQESPFVVLRDGTKCLMNLAHAAELCVAVGTKKERIKLAEEARSSFWASVADDCDLCAVLLDIWRVLPTWKGPYIEEAEEAANNAQRCVTYVCESRGRAIASAGTFGADDWVYGREVTLSEEAVNAACEAYAKRADAVPDVLVFAAAVAAAFRGATTESTALSVTEAIRSRTDADPSLNLPNALIMCINRWTPEDDGGYEDDGEPTLRPDSQWACIGLVTELIEPPCVFSNNDLQVLLDVVLRQLQDTDISGTPSKASLEDAVARLELVREAVFSDWFIRVRHRAEDIVAIIEALAENAPPTEAALTCLAKEIIRAAKGNQDDNEDM